MSHVPPPAPRSGLHATPRPPGWRLLLLAFLGGSLLCFLLRGLALRGGDTFNIESEKWSYFWDRVVAVYMREPLGHLIPYALTRLLHDRTLAFQIVSSLCGGAYLSVLLLFSRRAVFLLPNLATIIVMNFIGHVEFYATVAVGLTLYFHLLLRALEPDPAVRPVHVVAAFGFAYLCHKMALIYTPTLLCLLLRRGPAGWGLRPWPRRDWERAILCLIAVIFIDLAPTALAQIWPDRILIVFRDDTILELITPLTPALGRAISRHSATGVYFLYTLGQPLHWKYFLFFAFTSAPLAVPVIAFYRRRLRGEAALALLLASLLGVGWTFLWHPHMGWDDWDLFCLGWLPVNLLAGALAAGLFHQHDASSLLSEFRIPHSQLPPAPRAWQDNAHHPQEGYHDDSV